MRFAVEMMTRGVDFPRYRRVYFSEPFNRCVVSEANLLERTLLECESLADGRERRRMRVVPRLELPKLLVPLLQGHAVHYEEVSLFDPSTRSAELEVHTIAGDRLRVGARVEFIEQSDGVRACFDCHAQVRVFGLASVVERHLAQEVTQRYALVERALQRFFDEGRERELNDAIN